MTNLKKAALAYAAQGLPVFPVSGKVPRTQNGLLDATTDAATVAGWWDRWPSAGIGMPTGKASGRVVIDIDPRHQGDASLEAWEQAHGTLPFTLTANTGGGGCHFHYRYPPDVDRVPNGANVLGKGVDVRGDGGYVVMAPSPHASGTAYAWQDPDQDMEELPDLVVARLTASAAPAPVGAPGPEGVATEGGRNVALTKLAGRLRRAGLTAEELLTALSQANLRVCSPPLPDREVSTIAASIGRREGDPVAAAGQSSIPLTVVGADELAAMDLPKREFVLDPVFKEKNLCMIFAERGIGKTLLGVGWGLAIANGGDFLRWKSKRPRRVLYIDGELAVEDLRDRVVDVAKSARLPIPPNFRLATPDLQLSGGAMPDLSTPEGQAIVLAAIEAERPEVVILDNLSTLVRGGEENGAESWQVVQDFLIHLRTRRISVVMLHHTGKAGTQRGTSKREDVLDLVVQLSRPEDYLPEQGARFVITYTKARSARGDGVRPCEAWLADHEGEGESSWRVGRVGAEAEQGKLDRLLEILPTDEQDAIGTFRAGQDAGLKSGTAGPFLMLLRQQGLALCKSTGQGRSGAGQVWWRA